MPKLRWRHAFMAVLVALAMLAQGTWALAGTTGNITGTLTDTSTGKPVADASIGAVSPSQSAQTRTDAGGHFTFLGLAPDTYTVSATKQGYAPVSIAGVSVFADQSLTLNVTTHPELKTIATVTSRAAGNLVKPGTTSDVYSVNAATQQVVGGSSGGFNLNQAYSAIYSQPGVTSYIGNFGWGQVFYIRGSAYSQVGYEFDGVPVNRAFDNYQANSLANIGQQELQVYTGGSPSGASSATLGGFINQVIKTGTYPGFGTLRGGIGVPGFYHGLTAEAGGSNPNRTFSYYVGLMGYDQHYPFGTFNNLNDVSYFGNDVNGLLAPFEVASEVWATGGNTLCGAFGVALPAAPAYCAGNPDGGMYGTNFEANGTVSWQNGPWAPCQRNGLPANQPLPGAGIYNGACLGFGPFTQALFIPADMFERDNVANVHFAIPHRHDSGRDDVQLLWDNSMQFQPSGNAINQNGGLSTISGYLSQFAGAAQLSTSPFATGPFAGLCGEQVLDTFGCASTNSPIGYMDTLIFAPGTRFGQPASTASVVPYLFPSSNANRTPNNPFTADITSGIPTNLSDSVTNDASIIKLQYTKNLGSNAYARIFGYTFYSDWLINGPTDAIPVYFDGLLTPGLFGQETGDYELATHSRGAELQLADQINAQNLLRFTANYTTATVTRWNNGSWRAGYSGSRTRVTDWTNGDPNNPICYAWRGANAGFPAACDSRAAGGTFGDPMPLDLPTACGAGGTLAGTPGCASFGAGASNWLVTVPGGQGTFNTVQPNFWSGALEDEIKPNDRLDLNIGVRYEGYQYLLPTLNNNEFNFWFNNYAQVLCYDPGTGLPMFTPLTPGNPAPAAPFTTGTPLSACGKAPSGQEGLHPVGNTALCNGTTLVDCGAQRYTAVGPTQLTHAKFSPRIGGTFTWSPDTVLRFSAGMYTQPTETAFEQYSDASGKRAAAFDFGNFWGLGFTNPVHDNPVQYSLNYDFSFEHRFHNTDITMKLSPFYRDTHNEVVSVVLGPNFASGINVGHQHSFGVEFQIAKGDPTRDGLSGALSYTYTRALLHYGTIGNGIGAIDYLNNYVKAFNKLTSAGGGAACYQWAPTFNGGTGTSIPDPACSVIATAVDPTTGLSSATGSTTGNVIKNPYFNEAVQPLLDPTAYYDSYPNEPPNDPIDQGVFTAIWPHQISAWIQYKHQKWAIAPNLTMYYGGKYGSPTDVYGVDPRACVQNQSAATDATGAPIPIPPSTAQNPDFQSCVVSPFTASGFLAIPNPYTGKMDNLGQWREPWQMNVGALITYQFSPKVSANIHLTNIFNTCWGGSSTPWSSAFKPGYYTCAYQQNNTNYIGPLAGQPGFGGGFFYGDSPTSAANGSPNLPKPFLYPWASLNGGEPFEAYFELQIRL
jgi:hypothetical protein